MQALRPTPRTFVLSLILLGATTVVSGQTFEQASAEVSRSELVDEFARRVEEIVDRKSLEEKRTCCEDTCPCCCPGWTAGFEATFMRPVGVRTTVVTNVDTQVLYPEYDFDIAPRFWLEYVGSNCIGARARYWQFDHSSDRVVVDVLGVDAGIVSTSLELHEVDLELTYRWRRRCWNGLVSGGLRYFDSRMTERLDQLLVALPPAFDVTHSYGIGPTVALENRFPVPRLDGFSIYLNGRLSVVGGDTNQSRPTTSGEAENLFAMGELQTGLQFKRRIRSASWFLRVGMEGHAWSTTAPIDFSGPRGLTPTGSVIGEDDQMFGLVGFGIAAGFTR